MSLTSEEKKELEGQLKELKKDLALCGEVTSDAIRAAEDEFETLLLMAQFEAIQNMVIDVETELNNEPIVDA